MENKNKNPELVNLVEKLLSEALKKKEKAKKKSEKKDEKMADKDYDGDGEVESSKDEYFGSKDKAIKKAMGKKEVVSKDKKKKMNEGRVVGNDSLHYGGFPKVISEAEYKIPAKESERTDSPAEVGIDEFEKLMKAGSHPIMAGQSNETGRGVSPEIRAKALEHIKILKSHPKGAVEGYGKDHPVFKQGMEAHEFFKTHFPEFGVEEQIASDYNLPK